MNILNLNPHMMLQLMTATLFILGLITFVVGIFILALRAPGRDIQALAAQTSQLAQKGIAEEVAGLVGNAASLMDGMNQLMRTATGVGVFLTLLGGILMGVACYLVILLGQSRI